ncbi:nicotinate-nucleotide--dimethylbenzimidazole phosphoribosyltransferase [Thiorhodococcus fuscus]|uniref:Nicotinate-nucleotide--dimethylbenzimidazole phosphoribosyltransferase n=1 Tax=Thiorhodococcus fuscus TaxID=527200 RepID=A0ABW4Y7L0_9GAMM
MGDSDPYRRLARCGCREFAALVGAAIAAGQIGIPMLCLGRGGDAAFSLIRRLHPGVLTWLAPSHLADMPRPEARGRQGADSSVRTQLSPASEGSCLIGARSCSI